MFIYNLIKIWNAFIWFPVELMTYDILSAKFRDKYNYFKWINYIWLYSLFWALMPLIGWGRYSYDNSISACTIDWRHNDLSYKSYIIAYFMFGFMIPLVIILFCYYNIVKKVRDGSAVNRGNAKLNGEDIWVKEKTVTVVSELLHSFHFDRPLGL